MNNSSGNKFSTRNLLAQVCVFFLFSFLTVLQVEAITLYQGKSSDIFKDNRSEFSDTKILESIVAEARKKQIQHMTVSLLFGTTLPFEEYQALGPSRFKAVKEYFEKEFPGVVVTGQGVSLSQPTFSTPATEGPQTPMSSGIPDLFFVVGGGGKNAKIEGEPETDVTEPAEPLEEWQQVLLARYRKVEEAQRPICEKERPDPRYYGDDCPPSTLTLARKEYEMCMLRKELFIVRVVELVDDSEYDLERMLQLRKTIEEVAAIAEEIVQRTGLPRASNNPISALDREIELQKLAIKYMKRAVEKINLGLKAVGAIEDIPENNDDIGELATVYRNWSTFDRYYAGIYDTKTRSKNIKKVMALHNFIRVNLGQKEIGNTNVFPICVFSNVFFGDNYFHTVEEVDRVYEAYMVPSLHKYGIEEIPLK